MPIKVACACGAAFAAKDELAGRTVACPKCKQALTIPKPQAAAPAAPAAPHSNAGLFDDLGLKARDTSGPRCASCGADMAPNAVICIKCGFNTKLGRRMETIKMSGAAGMAEPGAGGHGGHGAGVTELLMARAAKNAEDDAIAEATKTTAGAPLWVWVVGLFCCILFGVVMSLVEQSTALQGTGWVMIVASAILTIFAWGAICARAFLKNPIFGFIVLIGDLVFLAIAVALFWFIDAETLPTEVTIFSFMLVGAASTGYAYTDSEGCAKYVFYSQIAYVLRVVGFVLLIIGWLVAAAAAEGNKSEAPSRPANAVVVRTAAA